MNGCDVIVYADKTVLKVQGLNIKGLNTGALEKILTEKFGSIVRVIGVTGNSLDMDVYGLGPEQIRRDEQGFIQTIAAAEGISLTDVTRLASAQKIKAVDIDKIPPRDKDYCAGERWSHHE